MEYKDKKSDDILEKLVHINRITKVVKGGRRFGFSALVVVGNQNGNVYLISSDLTDSASNFHRHALFVPTFFQMALKAGKTEPLYQTIGKDEAIGLSNQNLGNEEVIHIKNEDGSLDIIPEIRRIRGGLELRVFDQNDQYQFAQVQIETPMFL